MTPTQTRLYAAASVASRQLPQQYRRMITLVLMATGPRRDGSNPTVFIVK